MIPGIVLLVGLAVVSDPDVPTQAQIQKALTLQAETLKNFSVELENRFAMEGRGPGRRQPTKEIHYFGEAGQFKREQPSAGASEARPGFPGQGFPGAMGRRGFGGAGSLIPELIYRADLLARIESLDKFKVIGPASLESVPVVEIRCRPKIAGLKVNDLKVNDARLWIARDSGMPLKLQLRFSFGPMDSEATLTRELSWDEQRKITVSKSQKVEVSFGGFGEGPRMGPEGPGMGPPDGGPGGRGGFAPGNLEFQTTWQNYRWGLTFAEGFFTPAAAPAAAQVTTPQTRSAGANAAAFDEDPFQEIRLSNPTPGQPIENHAESNSTGNQQEVLIQGSSVAAAGDEGSGGGRGEGAVMARIMGGFGGGFGGEGGPGGGPGGPGGAAGGSAGGFGGPGGGGFRGMMIAGSRANRIQGSVTSGFSSSALDAKPYSLDGRETSDPGYLTWRAGVSVGGLLPGASSTTATSRTGRQRRRGGSSYFVDFNVRRGDSIQTQYATVPTALERQGDFSKTVYRAGPLAGTPVALYDPTSGAPLAGTALPGLNPASVAMLSFIPLPNRADPVLNFLNQETLGTSENRLNTRLMFGLSDSQRLAVSYSFSGGSGDRFNIFPSLNGQTDRRGQNVSLNWNTTFRQGLVNSLRVDWNRNRNQQTNAFALNEDIAAKLGIQNTSRAPIDYGLPTIQLTNFTSLDDGSSSKTVRERNGFNDSLMWVRGKHFFRFGGEMEWNRWDRLGSPAGSGVLNFAGVGTSAYENGLPVPGTGYDFADFLLGLAQSSRIQYGNSDHYLRRPDFSLFVNDNWRLASRFTLQWGLRYRFVAPWVEKYNRLANLDIASGFSAVETVEPGAVGAYYGQFPRALVQSDWSNIAPRVALAFRLNSGKWASVLRSSYGIFYPGNSYDYFVTELMAQPPFGYTVQKTVDGTDFLNYQTAFSEESGVDVANTFAVDPRFRLATVQNWDLSIQQALPMHLFMSVGYAGARGTGLEMLRAPNRTIDGGKLIQGAAEFLYLTPGGSSIYHGLQVLMMRRIRSGLAIGARYEFGKSLDNASSLAGGQRTVAENDQDLAAEWSRSSLDQTHRLRLTWFTELPFGDRNRWFRENGIFKTLLSHWYLNGDLSAASGNPLTARILGNQVNNSGTASQASERASMTGLPIMLAASDRTTLEWFNTAAFRLPDPGTFGNAGRNTITGPGSWTVNTNLSRSIPLKGEARRLMITVQGSNLLNHANYAGINTIVNSTGFGRVTSVGQMRQVQLNLRYMF